MILTNTAMNFIPFLIANDVNNLAATSHAPQIQPYLNNVTPTSQTALSDLTLNGTLFAPKDGTVGAQASGVDAKTGDIFAELIPPVGGFKWVLADSDLTDDVTVYGYIIKIGAGHTLFAIQPFDEPVTLHAGVDNLTLEVGPVRLNFNPNTLLVN